MFNVDLFSYDSVMLMFECWCVVYGMVLLVKVMVEFM